MVLNSFVLRHLKGLMFGGSLMWHCGSVLTPWIRSNRALQKCKYKMGGGGGRIIGCEFGSYLLLNIILLGLMGSMVAILGRCYNITIILIMCGLSLHRMLRVINPRGIYLQVHCMLPPSWEWMSGMSIRLYDTYQRQYYSYLSDSEVTGRDTHICKRQC